MTQKHVELSPADVMNAEVTSLEAAAVTATAILKTEMERALLLSDQEALDAFVVLQRSLENISEALSEVNKFWVELKQKTIPALLTETDEFGGFAGYRSAKSGKFGYTLSVSVTPSASIAEGRKEEVFNYLRGKNYGDDIKETIHSGRLKTIHRELTESGEEIPEGLFEVYNHTTTSVRKSTKKGPTND